MKTILQLVACLVIPLGLSPRSTAQSTFINLNFDQAVIIPIPGSPYYPVEVAISDAMPGWTAYGNFLGQHLVYNTVALGSPALSIHDRNGSPNGAPLQGNYSTFLQAGTSGATHPAIGQVGTIPADAQSVRFYATGPFSVSFAGQALPVVALGMGENRFVVGVNPLQIRTNFYSIYGANLPALAGQTGELIFQEASINPVRFGSYLDNIFFYPDSIPEPSTCVLGGLAILAFALFRKRRFSR